MKKRILHIINDLGVGGAQRLLVSILKSIDRNEFECIVLNLNFIRTNELESEVSDLGIIVENYRALKIGDPFCIPFIMKCVKKYKIDIIHSHLNIASFYASIAGKLAGVSKIVSTEHNTSSFITRKLYRQTARFYLRWNDAVIAISHAVRQSIIDLLPDIEHKISVIYNGVNTDFFKSDKVRDYKSNEIRIGTLARNDPRKGLTVFNECAKLILKDRKNFCFFNAGLETSNLSYIQYIKLDGSQESVREYLDSLHIFVLPSLEEGLGLVALEAMAMRLPVIATDVGGLKEVVQNRNTGLTVSANNSAAIAQAIECLFNDQLLSRHLAANGRKMVQERFSEQVMTVSLQEFYGRLCN